MTEPILETRDLTKRYAGLVATNSVSLSVAVGECRAVIGPNGAGKTTLIAQLAGEIAPTSGRIFFRGHDITQANMPQRSLCGIARTFQITSLCKGMTAADNVALAVQAHSGHGFRFWRNARTDPALTRPAQRILEQVGLSEHAGVPAGNLAHGLQRQLELAVALATDPQLLLLDEPMAGMSGEDSNRMISLLRDLKRRYTILLIEHDMDAVFQLADSISVLAYGSCIATGEPESIRADLEVRNAYLG